MAYSFPSRSSANRRRNRKGPHRRERMTSVENPAPASSLAEMLSSFVTHFTRAIRQEMDAMRERRGPFEIALIGGERIESDDAHGGGRFTYRVLSADEKLVAGVECTLRTLEAEHLVRVERFEGS